MEKLTNWNEKGKEFGITSVEKKVKFSTYYTNPFNVLPDILSSVKFEKTKNPIIKNEASIKDSDQ